MMTAAKIVTLAKNPDHHRYQRPEPFVTPRKVRKSLTYLTSAR